jgi:chromosome segregation ATPase
VILSGKVMALTELNSPECKNQIQTAFESVYAILSDIFVWKFQLESMQARLQQLEQQPALAIAPVETPSEKPVQSNRRVAMLQQQKQHMREQIQQLESELAQAKDRVEAMESSKFWKLRSYWFSFKKTLGLPSNE